MKKFFSTLLPENKLRIEGLDLLRAFAILFVVIYHAWAFISPYFPKQGMMFFLGFWGVELFFVLSGFLVGGIFIRSFLQNGKNSFSFVFSFWKRRWKRTIPIYIVVLISSYVILNTVYKLDYDFPFKYFFFLQNLWYIHPRFFPEAWSLAVEEWFYISLPFSFLLGNLFLKTKSNRNIFIVIITGMLVYTVFRMPLLGNTFDIARWDFSVRKIVFFRLDAIFYGVLAYQLISSFEKFFKKYRYYFLLLSCVGVFFSYALFHQKIFPIYNNIFFLSTTSLSMSLSLPFFIHFKFRSEIFKRLFTIISVSSYTMYLIHYTLLFRIFNTGLVTTNLTHATIIFVAYLITVFISSILVYKFIERPLTRA